jgi:hypothetical protein
MIPSDLTATAAAPLNTYVSARLFQVARVVLLVRTSEPFRTISDIEQCITDFARFIPASRRGQWRIIIDMREGPTRVDPSLEPAFERFRRETHAGFSRVAIVVNTPLGKVRAERLSNVSDVPQCVVGSLAEAVAFIDPQESLRPRH